MEWEAWLFDSHLIALKLFDEYTPPQKLRFGQEKFWVQMHNMPFACMNEERGSR